MNIWSVKNTTFPIAVLAGALALPTIAQTGNVKTDAQVEANVLRALAGAEELSTQNIQSTTTYGVVTLTGSVQTEQLRSQAENLTARAAGVKKVVDEMTLGAATVADNTSPQVTYDPNVAANSQSMDQAQPNSQANDNCVLQSDGTCAPGAEQADNNAPPPPNDNGNTTEPGNGPPNQGQTNQAQGNYPPPPQRQPMYGQNPNGQYSGPGKGQQAGLPITVPAGAVLNIRINRGLVTGHVQPGTTFDATVLTDVVTGGAVAIPRGATVQGTVVDAEKAGVLKGRGQLALQLNTLTLGGAQYPIVSDTWTRVGPDKTARTVNSALGLGALGAIFGGVAGGGAGAAIGAGVGGAVGVANSAASPSGQVIVPPESILTFHLTQPTPVTTVSQGELQRLAYTVAPPSPPRRRYPGYYSPGGYYYGR